jgi:hypothetical protein
MKTQTQMMTQIFSAFSAWAERGLRYSRGPVAQPKDDVVQEYEAAVMPVLPHRAQQSHEDHAGH